MQCTSPINVKSPYPVMSRFGKLSDYIEVPCGRCMACRIRRRTEWTVRLWHEDSYAKSSCFVTLTYDVNPITLNPRDVTLFLKRLRRSTDSKLRYYYCGEYGDEYNRPHYHMCLFGLGVKDKKFIEDAWGLGFVKCGLVEHDSIQYVAGYIEKKLLGDKAQYYTDNKLYPPFSRCSQGIGKQFALDNRSQIEQEYKVTMQGKSVGLPRYYRKVLGIEKIDLLPGVAKHQKEYHEKWTEKLGTDKKIDHYFAGNEGKKQHEATLKAGIANRDAKKRGIF